MIITEVICVIVVTSVSVTSDRMRMLGLAIGGQEAFSAKHSQLRLEAAEKNIKKND